jgi:glycerol-3-phosphate acyltransferase PlsY
MPKVLLVLAIVFVLIIVLSRYVSLASISAAVILPLLTIIFAEPRIYLIMSLILMSLIVYQHWENIERLRNGNERKIGS